MTRVDLPALGTARCQFITMCGKLEAGHKITGLKVLPKKPLVISYRISNKQAFLQILPWTSECKGLHIDCALRDWFPKRFIPKPNGSKAELEKIFGQLDGSPIEANINAVYEVPLVELPEEGLIRSLLAKHKTGGLTMSLTGATCKIEGTPVRELEWRLIKNGKDAQIEIGSLLIERIDSGYLIRCFKWAEKLFSIFVLGKALDDRT